MFTEINCASEEIVCADPRWADYGIASELQCFCEGEEWRKRKWDTLLHAYGLIQERLPNVHNFFILNATYCGPDLISRMDEFYRKTKGAAKEQAFKGHIFVTISKEEDLRSSDLYKNCSECFVFLKGFDVAAIRRMIELRCHDYKEEAAECAALIHSEWGISLPLLIRLVVNALNKSLEVRYSMPHS